MSVAVCLPGGIKNCLHWRAEPGANSGGGQPKAQHGQQVPAAMTPPEGAAWAAHQEGLEARLQRLESHFASVFERLDELVGEVRQLRAVQQPR